MTSQEKYERMQAHVSHLLTEFVELRQKFAMLQPLFADEQVRREYGSGNRYPGYYVLRQSLFLACCQDIAKLSKDSWASTPSLKRLMTDIQDPALHALCRAQSVANIVQPAENTDPEILELLKKSDEAESVRQAQRFDRNFEEIVKKWKSFESSPVLKAFVTVRNEVTAHTQLWFNGKAHLPTDLATLDIKWADLKWALGEMQAMVELLGNLIRDAGFAWDSLDEMLVRHASYFWALPESE